MTITVNVTMLGGTLDQRILFTLFEAKYNRDPISPLLAKEMEYVPKELHNCIPSTLNVSTPALA